MTRLRVVLMTIGFAIMTTAWSADRHDHDPRHGGVVTETKSGDYELVAKRDVIQLYYRGHDKVNSLDGATAAVTLLTGGEKTAVTLTPAGAKLEANGTFNVRAGTTVVAVVTRSGKPAQSVRFVIK